GVLAHAEVVVRAPHHHVARPLRRVPDGAREAAGEPLQVGEYAVAPLVTQAGQSTTEKRVVVHETGLPGGISSVFATLERFPTTFLEGFWPPCRPPSEV